LFDNDREGNEQFKGLNGKIFEIHSLESIYRKHKEKDIYGLILPVPESRTDFVTNSITQRYLVMEHYFSDEILENASVKGDNILTTEIFEIKGNTASVSESINDLDPVDFQNFKQIFEKVDELFVEIEAEIEEIII
jgi:hypothetical protein